MASVTYVGVQGSYKSFEIALFEDDKKLIASKGEGIQASSRFIEFFEQTLQKHNKSLHDLSFIAVDQGPGAFTSLRVIISTINGFAFSTNVKLVGVDGLDALANEAFSSTKKSSEKQLFVSLLNAYNNEVYYGLYQHGEQGLEVVAPKGYKKIDALLQELLTYNDHAITFAGNGIDLHKDLIDKTLDESSTITVTYIQKPFCSAEQVGVMGLELWKQEKNIVSELKPLYLKAQTFAVRK